MDGRSTAVLKKNPPIRFLVSAGFNYGDMMSTINQWKVFRQLGYRGHAEFIHSSKEKMFALFNLPRDTPDVYIDTQQNITITGIKAFFQKRIAGEIEPAPLGMTAFFSHNPCVEIQEEDPDFNATDHFVCSNPAVFLNVKIYYQLNNYPLPDSVSESAAYIASTNSPRFINDSHTYFTTNEVSTLDDAITTLASQNTAVSANVLHFIKQLQQHMFTLLPVYGKYIRFKEVTSEAAIGNFFQILTGAIEAKKQNNELQDKPLVLSVFYDYEKETDLIHKVIHAGEVAYEGMIRERDEYTRQLLQAGYDNLQHAIKMLNLKENFSIWNIKDPDINTRLASLLPHQTVLLIMGKLSNPVFEGIYFHSAKNILPPVREGVGTLQTFLSTGLPHLRCGHTIVGRWEPSLRLLQNHSMREEFKSFYNESNGFCEGLETWRANSDFHQIAGRFMGTILRQPSVVQYFQELTKQATTVENNRMMTMLEDYSQQDIEEEVIALDDYRPSSQSSYAFIHNQLGQQPFQPPARMITPIEPPTMTMLAPTWIGSLALLACCFFKKGFCRRKPKPAAKRNVRNDRAMLS